MGVSPVWQTSFANPDAPPEFALFGLGAHLAELTEDLKRAEADPAVIDTHLRGFGNLRAAVAEPGAALVEPVAQTFREHLEDVAAAYEHLAAKCGELAQEVTDFVRRRIEGSPDEDVPF